MSHSRDERRAELVLALVALVSVSVLGLITVFVFKEGLPAFREMGLWQFITGHRWSPSQNAFGIFPMLVGTFMVTLGALAIGMPLGLGCAVYMSEFSGPRSAALLKHMVELMAGIPSVVFGFVGLTVIVPFIRTYLGGPGFSVLASSIVLGFMILPTMVSVSYDALRAVPQAYRDNMLALGATTWQTVRMVVLPSAKSGILAAAILATGRAIGETMAVIMVAGNATAVPESVLDPVRTLTSNIALEMGYSAGLHRQALFATGIVLFVIVTLLNLIARAAIRGGSAK
ncbi:MAG: phosphate ABC transporter permease subunit PstC [Bacillota bacterium]|nr:phosphate ABC transporter permease subunit PstC [Candidatus Fermentithermobacillaceae bacterium]HOA70555.1 phosphate ABC transporter permease subunit PstC [Bacillota bacterium]HPT34909.1 phosphate ABC transporter permease subunit PstC [Bacillota bacterium]HPZ84902.1 phosphate ABC transporter permease subunit PstC [Bacillota bacterium]HQD85526.1 phosphate ABC transporter permease subunit PstC [Bacillota bacterium]